MVKTTKSHFNMFKKHFMHYVEFYGLTEWRYDIVHGDCGDAYSTVNSNSEGRVVTIAFNPVWCDRSGLPLNEASIRATAKHEANEMLVSDLYDLVQSPFKTMAECERARHTLVRRLDKIVPNIK